MKLEVEHREGNQKLRENRQVKDEGCRNRWETVYIACYNE